MVTMMTSTHQTSRNGVSVSGSGNGGVGGGSGGGGGASADDLHAWSIFRQNLNANFSDSALNRTSVLPQQQQHHNHHQTSPYHHHHHRHHHHSPDGSTSTTSSGAIDDKMVPIGSSVGGGGSGNGGHHFDRYNDRHHQSPVNGGGGGNGNSNGNSGPMSTFPLRESTVNAILGNAKYGHTTLKNQDAFTYLRFGLPRVKATFGGSPQTQLQRQKQQQQQESPIVDHQPPSRSRHYQSNYHTSQQQTQRNYPHQRNEPQQYQHHHPNQANINEELKRKFWSNSESNIHMSVNRATYSNPGGNDDSTGGGSSSEGGHSSGKEILPNNGGRNGEHRHHRPMTTTTSASSPERQLYSSPKKNRHHQKSSTTTTTTSSNALKASQSVHDLRQLNAKSSSTTNPHQSYHQHHHQRSNGDDFDLLDSQQQQQLHRSYRRTGSSPSPTRQQQQLYEHHHSGGGGGGGGHYRSRSTLYHSGPQPPQQPQDAMSMMMEDNDLIADSSHHNPNPTKLRSQHHGDHPGTTTPSPEHHHHGHRLPPPLAKHPHLVVKDLSYEVDKSPVWRRLCGFSRQKLRILEDINFDIRGGELMAVMPSNTSEGTALFDVLANRYDHRNGTYRAELYLNGVTITPRSLARVCGYVQQSMHFCPDMSTRQTLLFAGLLMGPAVVANGAADIKHRTRTILKELNLGEVRHTRVSELTNSERRRLHVAIYLLLDSELLFLDQPLQGLDIFDAFFLVEYLRHWASIGGRSVVMSIAPPTFEVFSMFNRVLLLSAGHVQYVGPRKDFIKYFTSLDFPCPPFKNPADYYLDLVTVDDLSQESLLESSQRVETLTELHMRRPFVDLFSSMPGPPAVAPPPFRRANLAMQFLALWIRALIFEFPYNVVHLFTRFLLAIILSILIGTIYWQVRATGREQEYVWDRMGFVQTILSVGVVPLLLGEIWNAHHEKQYIESEIEQGFYSLPAYLIAKTLYTAPQSMLIGLAYALPACSMCGLQLHSGANSLSYYLLLMLAYYFAFRMFAIASVWSTSGRSCATWLFATLFSIFLLSSGITIQLRDLSYVHRLLRTVSPLRWIHEPLIGWEFEPNGGSPLSSSSSMDAVATLFNPFVCSRNPVVQQPNAILVRADCGFQTRANILKWFDYQGGNTNTNTVSSATTSSSAVGMPASSSSLSSPDLRPWWHAFVALLTLYAISLLIGSILFCLRAYYLRDDDERRASKQLKQLQRQQS